MAAGFRQEFPRLPCYETFLRQINRQGPLGLLLLIVLLGQQEGSGTYALDATALPVSQQGRRAKVLQPWATWGWGSDGHWFFGFKLPALCDRAGQLVKLRISPANVADITQAEALLSQLRGLVVADAAYISAKLREKLWELGLLLLTPLRKNMKGLASLEQREQLKGRSIIETLFSVLKDRLGLVTSLPRSLDGYLWPINWLGGLLMPWALRPSPIPNFIIRVRKAIHDQVGARLSVTMKLWSMSQRRKSDSSPSLGQYSLT